MKTQPAEPRDWAHYMVALLSHDIGREFQTKFHWHVEDKGIRHAYIKRGTPQLNGKVERSHLSDQREFISS